MNLLPLVEWLRWIAGWHEWTQPPLRACFMFDDPNLHSTRYGFVKFRTLGCGRPATPLPYLICDRPTRRTLREPWCRPHPARQPGNALAFGPRKQPYVSGVGWQPAPGRTTGLDEASHCPNKLSLSKKVGVSVSRVMAPPHGVCSAPMMAAMMDAGFEAVCVSNGSVWTGNTGAAWTVSLGAFPALVVAGLPVIPRLGLDHNLENNVLLAAYLNQAIIPVGHHWDLADGTGILSATAALINRLGNVAWSNMAAITKTNYRFRVNGHRMYVQTFSRTTTVNVPEGVCELEIEAPWLDFARESIECRISSQATGLIANGSGLSHPTADRFCVIPGHTVDLVAVKTPAKGEQPYALPKTPFRVVVTSGAYPDP